ncbi:MAG: fructosamine kinase family protein, partial [Longimicrobiales bacterium]
MDSSVARVPAAVGRAVETAWTAAAKGDVRIASASRVAGGCISPAARVLSSAGEPAFLKWGDGDVARRMFAEEARSLRALAGAGKVRVPAVLGAGEHDGGGWLLLEWLEPGVA